MREKYKIAVKNEGKLQYFSFPGVFGNTENKILHFTFPPILHIKNIKDKGAFIVKGEGDKEEIIKV